LGALYQVAIKELKCPLTLALSPAGGGEGIKEGFLGVPSPNPLY